MLTQGKLTAQGTYGVGDAAYRMLPLDTSDPSKLTGGAPFDAATAQTVKTSTMLTGMPGVFNSDSIGYDKNVIPHVDSWAELFNPQYKGKVALINDPQIGPIDAALAAAASGKLKFGNIGNMTKTEIDNLIKLLIDMKKAGFFRGLLVDVHRVRQPDGRRRGRDREHVVARADGAARGRARRLASRPPRRACAAGAAARSSTSTSPAPRWTRPTST